MVWAWTCSSPQQILEAPGNVWGWVSSCAWISWLWPRSTEAENGCSPLPQTACVHLGFCGQRRCVLQALFCELVHTKGRCFMCCEKQILRPPEARATSPEVDNSLRFVLCPSSLSLSLCQGHEMLLPFGSWLSVSSLTDSLHGYIDLQLMTGNFSFLVWGPTPLYLVSMHACIYLSVPKCLKDSLRGEYLSKYLVQEQEAASKAWRNSITRRNGRCRARDGSIDTSE